MKKFINLFFILALVAVGFTSCEEKEEVPGGIPGMGNTPGELEIKEPFVAPEGITINLESENEATLGSLFSTQTQLKSTNRSSNSIRGCGGSIFGNDLTFWIKVKLTIQNTASEERCFELPAGLVFKVSDKEYQHGIVVSPVKICVEGNSFCDFSLVLMCINKGRNGTDTDVTYEMVGLTQSTQMWTLINLLYNRMVNIGFYLGDTPAAGLKSANTLDLEKYKEVADHIQNAVWTITNTEEGLSQEQIEYFKNLPEIE